MSKSITHTIRRVQMAHMHTRCVQIVSICVTEQTIIIHSNLYVFKFHSECYFTSDSMHRKVNFMQAVNRSSGEGGLTCSFIDREITQFIQFKKRQGNFSRKKAMPYIGLQDNSTWVLGPNLHIKKEGQQIDEDESDLQWIGHLVSAPKVANDGSQLPIHLPLGTYSSSPRCNVFWATTSFPGSWQLELQRWRCITPSFSDATTTAMFRF